MAMMILDSGIRAGGRGDERMMILPPFPTDPPPTETERADGKRNERHEKSGANLKT